MSTETVKVKLTMSYDGQAYSGWQIQKTGLGVQQRVEESLAKLFGNPVRIHSSSRTDTGVHAIGMVAHLVLEKREFRMTPSKLVLALNAHLPEDIRVVSASRCRDDFHARFDATGKQYRYFVWNQAAHNPLLRKLSWHIPQALDLKAMRQSAQLLVGRHDFKSFAATRSYEMASTVRTLFRCDVRKQGCLLTFILEGDGFLYKMCRGIVGTLVQVGQGKIGAGDIPRILETRARCAGGMSAPAHGLVLWKVRYRPRSVRKDLRSVEGAGEDPIVGSTRLSASDRDS